MVLVLGVLLFLLCAPSRRAGKCELTEPKPWKTPQAAFAQLDRIPDMDTVARVVEEIPAREVEEVLTSTLQRLLRNPPVERWVMQQRYLIAMDGTLKGRGMVRHAEEMLEKSSPTGTSGFPVYGVEAVLVEPQGLAIGFLTEFCENPLDRAEDTKHDSEWKALKRLAKRLKTRFRKRPIAILADGWYPNGPWFARLRAYRGDFMIVLPDGHWPAWQDDARRQHRLEPQNTLEHQPRFRMSNYGRRSIFLD